MRKLLIVDDEKEYCVFLKSFFEEAGYSVETRSNGLEAIEYLKDESVDLVILDILMPSLSGVETLRMIRERDIKTKVIMITAFDTLEKRKEVYDLGVEGYFSKPVSLDVLEKDIQDVLEFERKE